MHGLIVRSLQCFLRDTYGNDTWIDIAVGAKLGIDNFEALLTYDSDTVGALLDAASTHLNKPLDTLLDDLGTYLVSHENSQGLRRLLRFGGDSFVEFLYSLDELRDRARLAVPDLDMPMLELRDHSSTAFTLLVSHPYPGFGKVMVGLLRAMADDYGTLALLDFQGRRSEVETIAIELLEMSFAEGNEFELSVSAA